MNKKEQLLSEAMAALAQGAANRTDAQLNPEQAAALYRAMTDTVGPRSWEDKPTPDDKAIADAHPLNSGNHKYYARALEMVEARHSKYALVDLVNWLLSRAEKAEEEVEKWNETVTGF